MVIDGETSRPRSWRRPRTKSGRTTAASIATKRAKLAHRRLATYNPALAYEPSLIALLRHLMAKIADLSKLFQSIAAEDFVSAQHTRKWLSVILNGEGSIPPHRI